MEFQLRDSGKECDLNCVPGIAFLQFQLCCHFLLHYSRIGEAPLGVHVSPTFAI